MTHHTKCGGRKKKRKRTHDVAATAMGTATVAARAADVIPVDAAGTGAMRGVAAADGRAVGGRNGWFTKIDATTAEVDLDVEDDAEEDDEEDEAEVALVRGAAENEEGSVRG